MRPTILFLMMIAFTGAAMADIGGSFTLTRTSPDLWRADYCFDTPIESLSFSRPIEDFRQDSWTAATDGLALTYSGNVAQLRHESGAPFRCGAVEIRTNTMVPIKNYMPFSTFSDGGVSVYTGYMTGLAYKDGAWHEYALEASYKGLPGDQVITRDPTVLGHQFVYFGPQEATAKSGLALVVDPQIPTVARDSVLKATPKVIDLLADLFGYRPSQTISVFMAAGELYSSKGAHTKGGTQPFQILFTIKGEKALTWAIGDPLYFPKFAMHEMVHIWQDETWAGQLGEDEPWIHEGGADALAMEFMLRSGAYDEAQYLAEWQKVERRCLSLIAESSVHGAVENGAFDTLYQCGALVNRLVGAAINPEDPGKGVIRFWQAMSAWPEDVIQTTPSEQLFFQTLKELGFQQQQVAALRAFLEERPDAPIAALDRVRGAFSR